MSQGDWDIFKIGSLAGLMSFAWLAARDVYKFYRRPRLCAEFNVARDLRTYTYSDSGWVRRVATMHVRNKRATTATRAVATLRFLERPNGTEHLEESYALHWAGVDYTRQNTGAEPVDIGLETRRLDIVFTDKNQSLPGSWLAIPFALSGQLRANQAYLPPGKYKARIEVSCENGIRDEKKLWITSPSQWDQLEVWLA